MVLPRDVSEPFKGNINHSTLGSLLVRCFFPYSLFISGIYISDIDECKTI